MKVKKRKLAEKDKKYKITSKKVLQNERLSLIIITRG